MMVLMPAVGAPLILSVLLGTGDPTSKDPGAWIGAANAAARVEPAREGFINAIQQYPWSDGALYQLYASPGHVTDIALEKGEKLIGTGLVAAGDTSRWIIGDTVSGSGENQRVHILVKPTRVGLLTNLIINTDRRTYHVEMRSVSQAYMASISWTYPKDALIALAATSPNPVSAPTAAREIEIEGLNFAYRIDGDRVPWRPVRVFDDGRQVFVELAPDIASTELPPLFVLGTKGEGELVNYRLRGKYLVVDRLFSRAEFRIGAGKGQKRVKILRETPVAGAARK